MMKTNDLRAKIGYRGAGKAWLLIVEGEPVALRYMDCHPHYTAYSREAKERAGCKRTCPASGRAAKEMNKEAFLAWREEAKAKLNRIRGSYPGASPLWIFTETRIESGMVSCWEFITKYGEVIELN